MTKELRGGIGNAPALNFEELLTHTSERPAPAAPVERANTRVNISDIRPLEDELPGVPLDQPVKLKRSKRVALKPVKLKRSKRVALKPAKTEPSHPFDTSTFEPPPIPLPSAEALRMADNAAKPPVPSAPDAKWHADIQRFVMQQRSRKAAGLLLFIGICALLTTMFYLDLGLIATAITVVVVGIAGLSLQRAIAAVLNFAFGIGVYASTTLVLLLSVVAVCSVVTGGIWWRGSVVGAVILGMLSFMGHVLLRVSTDKEKADAMNAMAANRT